MRPVAQDGARFGIVLNGLPLFIGGAGSAAMCWNPVWTHIALSTEMFYNFGIATHVWILSNCKGSPIVNEAHCRHIFPMADGQPLQHYIGRMDGPSGATRWKHV